MSLDKDLERLQWALGFLFLALSVRLIISVLHFIDVCIEATK